MKKTVFLGLPVIALSFGFILAACSDPGNPGNPGSTNEIDTGVFVSVSGTNVYKLEITNPAQTKSVSSREAKGLGNYILKMAEEIISQGTVDRSTNTWSFTSVGNKTWSATVKGKSLSVKDNTVPKDDGNSVQIGTFEPQKTEAEIKAFNLDGQWINPYGSNNCFKFKGATYEHFRYSTPDSLYFKGSFSLNTGVINFTRSDDVEPAAWSQGFEIIGNDVICIVNDNKHNFGPFIKVDFTPSIFEGKWKKDGKEMVFLGNFYSAAHPTFTITTTGLTNGYGCGAKFTYKGSATSGTINFELGPGGIVRPASYTLSGNTLSLQGSDFQSWDFLLGNWTKEE